MGTSGWFESTKLLKKGWMMVAAKIYTGSGTGRCHQWYKTGMVSRGECCGGESTSRDIEENKELCIDLEARELPLVRRASSCIGG
jgi:hypothetical protein